MDRDTSAPVIRIVAADETLRNGSHASGSDSPTVHIRQIPFYGALRDNRIRRSTYKDTTSILYSLIVAYIAPGNNRT
jgi:hypothetical protein